LFWNSTLFAKKKKKKNLLVREGCEAYTISHVELVLELHPIRKKKKKKKVNKKKNKWKEAKVVPVKTQSVKESRECLHNKQHSECCTGPDGKTNEDQDNVPALDLRHEHTIPEHGGEFGVCEREGPKTQVGGSVGDGSEHELDGVDDLVDHDFCELELWNTS
jgi:hypothetical protein